MKNSKRFGNPAYPNYFADPFVFRLDGHFYAVGTGEAHHPEFADRVFPMLRSEDFINWTAIDGALLPPDPSLGTDFWAPEIVQEGDRFFLYYSVGFADRNHQLRVATSDTPLGPFRDTGEPVLDPKSCGFAIDPNPFKDEQGNWYLFYARDLLDGDRPGTSIVMAQLDDMRKVRDDYQIVVRAAHDWQRFERGRAIYGSIYDWHTLEGPCVIKHLERYYCLYSAGNWQDDTYGLDYLSSDAITGPFEDDNDGSGPRLLKTVPRKVIGPGHNSVVVGPNDITQYIAYHAWDAAKNARRLCFDVLDWTPNGPRCQGPTWEPKVVDW
jgi:beta-xylosidase